ncbi:MAG: SDR family NAD(P)-dependent oxidoreductase [Pseudomonadota bacterium]
MDALTGRNAFITGGASGIGLAMAQAFLNEGMNVAIADVDADALAAAQESLAGSNAKVVAIELDVTNRARFVAAAEEAEAALGPIHVLCNNAGVYRGGTLNAVTYEDWYWVMGVNVGGVVNGVQTFVQRMQQHGEGGHIVNTASMAGVATQPGMGVYNTSKFAVVGLSEAMRTDLAPLGIGVSVLCPGMVRTRILESERTRPAHYEVNAEAAVAAAAAQSELMNLAMNAGIEVGEVAEQVVAAVKADALYIFPHPELKGAVEARATAMLDAFGEPDPERLAAQEQFMAALLGGSTDE